MPMEAQEGVAIWKVSTRICLVTLITNNHTHTLIGGSTVKWTCPLHCKGFSESDPKLYTNVEF